MSQGTYPAALMRFKSRNDVSRDLSSSFNAFSAVTMSQGTYPAALMCRDTEAVIYKEALVNALMKRDIASRQIPCISALILRQWAVVYFRPGMFSCGS